MHSCVCWHLGWHLIRSTKIWSDVTISCTLLCTIMLWNEWRLHRFSLNLTECADVKSAGKSHKSSQILSLMSIKCFWTSQVGPQTYHHHLPLIRGFTPDWCGGLSSDFTCLAISKFKASFESVSHSCRKSLPLWCVLIQPPFFHPSEEQFTNQEFPISSEHQPSLLQLGWPSRVL
jgi:hypothetical protein